MVEVDGAEEVPLAPLLPDISSPFPSPIATEVNERLLKYKKMVIKLFWFYLLRSLETAKLFVFDDIFDESKMIS